MKDEKKLVEPAGAAATSKEAETTDCGGIWKIPRNCNPNNYTCEYSAKWELIPRKDTVIFTITTKHIDTWTGIGFSQNERMSQTDAILGWVDKTGRPFLMDTWINGYSQPLLDSSQNIFNATGKIVDGVTTLSFARKRITDDPRDASFTDDKCFFMMFPTRGGAFNAVNKKIRKHEVIPTVSTERICIRSCGNDDSFEEYLTSTEAPALGYDIKVKLVELGENFKIPKEGSIQYVDFTNFIEDSFKPVFKQLPGYRKFLINRIDGDDNNVVATINLKLDQPTVSEGRSLSDDTAELDNTVHKLLQDSVSSGKMGSLKLDPQYLVFEPKSITTNLITDASSSSDNSFFNLTETKLYIVLGCIVALMLVAIVQAGCTIYKARSRSSSNHKDHLIPNSAWKDYSSNTNYAFDAFESPSTAALEEKKQLNGSFNGTSAKPTKGRHIQRPQTRPPSVPPAAAQVDTRSLQRPRGVTYSSSNIDRNTFSLPRTVYDRNHYNQRQGPDSMQPADFYFMPSQRKYSGEVVRVYVDYNNQPK